MAAPTAAASDWMSWRSRSRLKVIHFCTNYGQTAALMAGFTHARGEIILPMDGDLQNDPADIPRLLAKLDEGYDVVSGWHQCRQDPCSRTLASRLANRLIARASGIGLHDFGCTMKAYRRSILEGLKRYGEMHRFIPIYASWMGARIAELPVAHHPRRQEISKYGFERILKVLLDLLVVMFLSKFLTRPIYLFGFAALLAWVIALVSGVLALDLRFFHATSLIQTPLPLLAAMSFLAGLLCLLMGLQAVMMVRVHFESQDKNNLYHSRYPKSRDLRVCRAWGGHLPRTCSQENGTMASASRVVFGFIELIVNSSLEETIEERQQHPLFFCLNPYCFLLNRVYHGMRSL